MKGFVPLFAAEVSASAVLSSFFAVEASASVAANPASVAAGSGIMPCPGSVPAASARMPTVAVSLVTPSLIFVSAPPREGKTRDSSGALSREDKTRSVVVTSFLVLRAVGSGATDASTLIFTVAVSDWVSSLASAAVAAFALTALRQARSGAPSSHRRFASRKASLANFFVPPSRPCLASRSAIQSSRSPSATALSARARTAAFHFLEGLPSSSSAKKGIVTRGYSLSPRSPFAVAGSSALVVSPAGAPPSEGKACWSVGAPPPEGETCFSAAVGDIGSGSSADSPSASISPTLT
mmetsp:Transcript_37973/g.81143  ORF Transcript_37973/g.81143 Transcript_37973/m.81143 type:complete len:295 (-) Transcript_37973:540-1424(-)